MRFPKTSITLIIVFIAIILIVFFLRSPEDTWICEKGQWLKHGRPEAPAPTTECR